MAQPVETATILNAQPFWMLLEMYKQTDRRTDATKRIISPASRSIKIILVKDIQSSPPTSPS